MRLRLIASLAGFAALFAAAGCFDAPRPNCAFLCGPANECPEEYVCASDNRCHLVENGVPVATCDDELPADAAIQDAPIDASLPDAQVFDAGPDAAPDASVPVTSHTGTISIQDLQIANAPTLGSGLSVSIDFPALDPVAPIYEEIPGSAFGCKAWVYDLTAGQFPPAGGDQGTVTITGSTAAVPPCTFIAGKGYLCIAGAGAASIAVADDAGGAGTAGVVVTGATFTSADVGRYLSVGGATNAGNNGQFPIVALGGADTLIVGNPGAVSEAGFSGTYTVVAGAGPVPGAPDPILDADVVTVGIEPGGGNEFDFADTVVNAGNAFTLNAASQALIMAVPTDGSAISFDCASGSCVAGSATGSLVVLQTTDGAIPPGAPPYYMPPPSTKVGVVRCSTIGASAVPLPAAAMAAIDLADPTRIRTTFFRVGLGQTANADMTNPVNVVVGHGVAGFTTIVAPATCTDGLLNGTETDVDCGGTCPLNCADNEMCASAGDCTSGVCAGSVCQVPTCSDGVMNGTESDIDCGGATCGATCVIGDTCGGNGDCVTNTCTGGLCAAAIVCSPDLAPADDGSGVARQALVISEIDPGAFIELHNNTAAAILTTGSAVQLCSPFAYWSLSSMPGITIPANGYATLPWPPSFTDVDAGGEVILYLDAVNFDDGAKIMDFVCWGTNPHDTRKPLAESAGKWTAAAACAGVLTGGSIHRLVGTDGLDPADYDVASVPSPMNCAP